MATAAPAYCHPAAYQAFLRELPAADTPRGLLRTATAVALHADPTGSIDAVAAEVDRIASGVRRRLRSESEEAAAAHLHEALFDLAKFRGAEPEDYYRPENSYLPHVLATKRGLPITLVLLYRSVAAELGLRVEGVNAPGHFLAELRCREPTGETVQYVDPFHGGGLLTPGEAVHRIEQAVGRPLPVGVDPLPIATPVAWLRRMLINLQAVFAQTNQERDLLAMQELEALLPAEG